MLIKREYYSVRAPFDEFDIRVTFFSLFVIPLDELITDSSLTDRMTVTREKVLPAAFLFVRLLLQRRRDKNPRGINELLIHRMMINVIA